jgi:CyaY protein
MRYIATMTEMRDPPDEIETRDMHDVDDARFDTISRAELRQIEDALAEVDPDDVEVSSSDGILRLDLRDGTRIVINTHRAARQIWMAAVSSAWHFDRDRDGRWRAKKTGDELRQTVSRVVQERIKFTLPL